MTASGGDRNSLLGVVLAGGRSRRFGEDKALAELGGSSLVERAAAALRPATGRVVLVASDRPAYESLGLEMRPDLRPGVGPLGGIHAAVSWAAGEGLLGALVLACDMPFASSALLSRIGGDLSLVSVVVPASPGPRGFEPLCAGYGAGCLSAIERAMDRGERAVVSFFDEVDVRVLDSDTVASYGDPRAMFFNVNHPEDRSVAEDLLSRPGGPSDPGSQESGT